MSFQDLRREVQAGLDGRNNGIPMGFDRYLLAGLLAAASYYFLD